MKCKIGQKQYNKEKKNINKKEGNYYFGVSYVDSNIFDLVKLEMYLRS